MITQFGIDHITISVTDTEKAVKFFTIFGFKKGHDMVIKGAPFDKFMSIDNLEARHYTMVHDTVPMEIQILQFLGHTPKDPATQDLNNLGYNHMCFWVKDIAAAVEELKDNDVQILSDTMDFNQRRLVYIRGPEGIVIELGSRD